MGKLGYLGFYGGHSLTDCLGLTVEFGLVYTLLVGGYFLLYRVKLF